MGGTGRGRPDGEAQAAAIKRVAAQAPHREMIVAAVARITGSAAFRGSRRAQDFLRNLVDHGLSGELEHIKERSIGVAVFGRVPDYDTGADAVVRVAANDLRKRLTGYYQEAGTSEHVLIELQAGTYVPEIRIESPERPVTVPQPREIARPQSWWRVSAVAGWLLAAGLAVALLVRPVPRTAEAPPTALRYAPWTGLFDGGRSPQLILADAGIGLLRVFGPVPSSLETYTNRRFLEPPAGIPEFFRNKWKEVALKQLTSMADARTVSGFAQLARAAGRPVVVRMAREMQLNDLRRGDNFILLGSSPTNPWVELFADQLDFEIAYDEGLHTQVMRAHDPKKSLPVAMPAGVPSGTTGEAYAVLALVNGLEGRGRVLLAEGTNMEGTDVAAQLALDGERLALELRKCGADPLSPRTRFELLLRLQATAGSTRRSEVLARRCRTE